ncbi:hypothetical protein SLS56_005270 [Neofusicoccum ribis]|uniref:Uncharacterized protein n=1 Tax=Neofusicoccum ribis TaxID=45134 RepID=A0ABR3SU00_9PEZI
MQHVKIGRSCDECKTRKVRCISHSKVKGIIDTVESVLQEKATTTEKISGDFAAFSQTDSGIEDSDQSRQSFIKSYFENVHPVYPLLDRKVFERQALGPARDQLLAKSAPWFALYYVVLALGSQYQDGGSFDAGRGKAWRLFRKALCRLPEILIPKGTLINAQAVTSMAILDCQIGCPIPDVPDSRFGDLDWILTYARLARILSKAYESLFSVTATLKSRDAYYQAIDSVRANLDLWKESLPEEFRPGQPFRRHSMQMPGSVMIAVRIRLAYYNVIITLARLTLHVGNGEPSERQSESVRMLLSAARSILDLTKYLDLEPYTPLWYVLNSQMTICAKSIRMLGAMPLAALFILFDFVIHNPGHAETKVNLAFLDVAAGHFSRLEFASGGSLPSSLLSEFTHIARQHVQDVASGKRSISPGVMTANNQHDASKEKQENCGATAESTSLPEEVRELSSTAHRLIILTIPKMYTFSHDALTNMNVPGSLFLTEMDTTLPMEPQNIGFDLMGLFGPVINFASPFDQQVAFQPH